MTESSEHPPVRFSGFNWNLEQRGTAVQRWPTPEGWDPVIDMTNPTYTLRVDERLYVIPRREAETLIEAHIARQEEIIQAWIDGFLTGKGLDI